MRAYVRLLRVPGAAFPVASSLLGRLPLGMVVLAIVLLVRENAGSYALAGVVSAAYSVGLGLAAPVLGRLADRFGQTRVLVPCALGYAALLAVLVAAAGSAPVVVIAAAAAAGALFPPLSACMRVLWPKLVGDADLRESAFALDAIVVELAYVFGPLLVAVIVAAVGPAAGLVAAGGLSLFGTLGFAATRASRGWVPTPSTAGRGGALTSAGLRTVIASFAATSMAFGVLDVGLPAFAESVGTPASAGVLFAALGAGSLAGGLGYGARTWRGPAARRYQRLLLVFAVGLALLPLATSVPTMLVLAFLSGVGLAPGVICALRLIDQLTPPGTATEAYTWTTTANVAGTALGAVLAGAAVDMLDVRVALGIASVGVCGGVVVVALRSSTLRPAPAGALR